MDRVASLLVRAADLRRTLFASLPWGYRLATVFVALDNSSIERWGRMMGATLLKAGVTEMPDPGPRWNPEKGNPETLPRYYLMDAAKKAYAVALRALGNPADAEDILMDVAVAYFSGKHKLQPVPLHTAMSFVLKTVAWDAGNVRKKQRTRSLTQEGEDGDSTTLDLVDDTFQSNPYWNENPNQFRELADVFPEDVWQHEVIPALAREHPDMPLFFKLLGEGNSAQQIVEQGMLPHFDAASLRAPVQTWNVKVQKAKKIIRDIALDQDKKIKRAQPD